VTLLVPSARPHGHDLEGLRTRLSELDTAYAQQSLAAARAQADLAAFKARYHHEVGQLHEELDRLEAELAEAELGELLKRPPASPAPDAAPAPTRPAPLPRFTSDAVRKLFRDVAKVIHPDLARDADTRDRRHSLMIEANRAYALGDEATRLRLVRRIAQIEEQLELVANAHAMLQESPMWQLRKMVDEEAAKGKDLVKDMVRRLKRDILVATNRLDALRPPDSWSNAENVAGR